jgi:hypothetical protein
VVEGLLSNLTEAAASIDDPEGDYYPNAAEITTLERRRHYALPYFNRT